MAASAVYFFKLHSFFVIDFSLIDFIETES